jgi:hypothetical protein
LTSPRCPSTAVDKATSRGAPASDSDGPTTTIEPPRAAMCV